MLPRTSTEQSIRTCVVSSLPAVEPAKIRSIVYVQKSRYVSFSLHFQIDVVIYFAPRCAFVNFTDRESAETAVQAWASGVEIDGEVITVKWGRGKSAAAKTAQPLPQSTGVEVTT